MIYSLTEPAIEMMHEIGFDFELQGKYRNSYYAIRTPDGVAEEISNRMLTRQGTLRDGCVLYSITSAGKDCGDTSSIMINGIEYSKKPTRAQYCGLII